MTIEEPVHEAGHDLAVKGGGAELEELGERIAELAAQISAATYELLAMLREFDERGGWSGGFHSCAHWLTWRVGLDPGAAREKVRVARALGALRAALLRALDAGVETLYGPRRTPGCGRRLCDAHHVERWADLGVTSLANTLLLCRRHHRAVHEEGFSVELAPDGEARFYRPDGRPLPQAPALPVLAREPVMALIARLVSHGVDVDAGATLPDWWGGSVDYGWEIDWLRWRDHRDQDSAAG